MDSLFINPNSAKVAGSLFAGTVVLSQGGSINQAAQAVLRSGVAANGTPAEPPIVDAGVRDKNMMDEKSKHGMILMGLGVVGLLIVVHFWGGK